MIRYRRRYWVLAACLSAVAGFVDAIAYVHLGGFFVSFMSGNSTRLGVGLAEAPHEALVAGGLIAAFVLGVMLGALVNRGGDHGGGVRVLIAVSAMLALAALLGGMGAPALGVGLMAAAMGAENSVFRRNGDVSFGVTYMTGALVKLGQGLAAALTGGPRFGWAPYLILWAGLVIGAWAGASVFALFHLASVWFAAGAAAVLAFAMSRMAPPD